MEHKNKYKILFSGGGTGGSVAPLLAIYDELTSPPLNLPLSKGENKNWQGGSYEFLWLGTKTGVERQMVEKAGIKFRAIAAGKLRRYFSWHNFIDIFKVKLAFIESLWLMLNWRPSLVMSAGSFVSVPVVWAAWVLRVPVLIHQQDVRPGLANKLMAPFAKIITVTFEKSLADYGEKAVWTGNLVRREIGNLKFEIGELKRKYRISEQLPVVLILGGGTGSRAINELVAGSLGELTKFCQVIHITGKNKSSNVILEPKAIESQGLGVNQGDPIAPFGRSRMTNYRTYEFLDAEKMAGALKLADVIVTRAGMGVLSELSYLGKPAIIIPLPDSHQEENAAMFKEAAIVLEQKSLTAEKFVAEIKKLVENKELQRELSEKMGRAMKRGAEVEIARIVRRLGDE